MDKDNKYMEAQRTCCAFFVYVLILLWIVGISFIIVATLKYFGYM